MRVLTLRELNRTLLARQLLLGRRRLSPVAAVARLVALQAQYAPSPYVALWSRLEGFRKEQLTRALVDGRVVKASVMRGTLHVVARELYPFLEAAYIESLRGRLPSLGAERAPPRVRAAPVGDWPHHTPSCEVPWDEPLAPAAEGAVRVVGDYLRAYGPAAREDIEQFTFFKVRQIAPALEGLRTYEDGRGRVLYDLPRARLAREHAAAPVRFLPPFDSVVLAHRDRSRILPIEYYEAVIRRKNATTLATFTVDGFIAGSWRIEKTRGRRRLAVEPFAPLPARVRREVDAEGERLRRFYES
jgi:hypothetical protein